MSHMQCPEAIVCGAMRRLQSRQTLKTTTQPRRQPRSHWCDYTQRVIAASQAYQRVQQLPVKA